MEEAIRENCLEEYRISDQEALREYEVSLRFLHKGMIIRVGCKEVAFSDTKEGIEELNKYLTSPSEERTKWRKLLNN